MSYKTFYKKGDIDLVRLQIIQQRIYERKDILDIANYFGMHRNTVTAVMRIYEALAPPEFREKILSG
jgi:hypothetical protein